MKLGIASDHRGFEKKETIIKYFNNNYQIIDYGNMIKDNNDDYPIFSIKLSEAVAKKEVDFGITICGTGIGASISANKVKGIRCAKVDNLNDVIMSRKDNNANVIALNSNKDVEELINLIENFINTKYLNDERHQRRINIISSYEEKI